MSFLKWCNAYVANMCHSKNNVVIICSICLTFFQKAFGCVILFLLNFSINRSCIAHCGVSNELIHSTNRRWHEWGKQQCRTFRRVRLVIGSPQGHLSAETKTWSACTESRLSWDKMHTFTSRRFKVNQATLKQCSLACLHISMCLNHSDETVFSSAVSLVRFCSTSWLQSKSIKCPGM